ncbi:MAG TPA: M64 family metallopeptidase [Prolixibacteraceae bacterium]|nr:M64 family metallopeptidase [Prolixibacteraceae bacterium]
MKYLFLLLFVPLLSKAQIEFKQYFAEEGAVRYEYELVGNFDSYSAVYQQSKYLPNWGGNPCYLIDTVGYGTFRYQLYDLKSNQLVFQKGFSPLFWEWLDTQEARMRSRSFNQSLFFPRPLNDVLITIQTRNKQNLWCSLYTDTFKVNNYFVIDETIIIPPIDTLFFSGIAADKIDLLILAEGYQQSEMEKFVADADRLVRYLFSKAPFSNYKNRFNVLLVKTTSPESGTDIPGEGVFRKTAFNSHYYTFDSSRYLTSSDMKSIYDAVDGLAWDHLYLLVNESRYGGGGFYNYLNVCSSDNELSPFVFCHEFGHGFAGLADEYYTSSTSYDEYYLLDIEPVEANITTLVNFESKWKSMVDINLPIPTPRDSSFQHVVGVFEGGGYREKGIYSPVMSCWMKETAAGDFCPVCQKAIEQVILTHSK